MAEETRMTKIMIASLALATVTACAPMGTDTGPAPITDKQAKMLAKELGGKIAGKPVSCLSHRNAENVIRISDDMLLYRQSSALVYQNKLKYPCHGLARDSDVIVTETFGGSLCEGDLLKLVDRTSGIQGQVCSLGEFVPYRKQAG
jgi:hypothetical protein